MGNSTWAANKKPRSSHHLRPLGFRKHLEPRRHQSCHPIMSNPQRSNSRKPARPLSKFQVQRSILFRPRKRPFCPSLRSVRKTLAIIPKWSIWPGTRPSGSWAPRKASDQLVAPGHHALLDRPDDLGLPEGGSPAVARGAAPQPSTHVLHVELALAEQFVALDQVPGGAGGEQALALAAAEILVTDRVQAGVDADGGLEVGGRVRLRAGDGRWRAHGLRRPRVGRAQDLVLRGQALQLAL